MFGALPVAGGILDQPADLMESIRLWRFMRHVKDLMDKDDMETIHKSPTLVHMMNVIDKGEDEARAMIAAVKKATEPGGDNAVS